ncbi:hypothetical protein Megvenef_01607 [Candidatus Megaera venefica]|uniref:Uncharacterized protein n=1 Tax=Candidatus Megaera venefica TaxID=2055910 RepID=A0ABU5NEL5_9RICK|nr:hypothetical protein [Candidatus Megaera venefica]MEA0971623.1 hypothetical protein [Candidatus Megaera venefica]
MTEGLNIGIEDFKERNVVKKICKELVENDYISYEVPVFIDYDEWTVPTIGESDSVAFA